MSIVPRSDAQPSCGGESRPRQTGGEFDARKQQDAIESALRDPAQVAPPTKSSPLFRRGAKTLIALGAVAALGWAPVERLLATTSAEAIVNARLITLKAPIEGEVDSDVANLAFGRSLASGEQVVRVANLRANRDRLDDLTRQMAQDRDERSRVVRRAADLAIFQAGLETQLASYAQARVEQLDARVQELDWDAVAAEARAQQAKSAADRARRLIGASFVSQAKLDELERTERTAAAERRSLEHKRHGLKIERDAAARGVFIGDSYNDVPWSGQKAREVGQEIAQLHLRADELDGRLSRAEQELAAETQRFTEKSVAELVVPERGRVWEVLTARGEHVVQGQDLMRILDCSGAVVTAAVSEATYGLLRLGGAATFRLRGESIEHAGQIIGLNGLAAARANLAIAQTALAREPYHVTVEVPSLSGGPDCAFGRTGKVTFAKTPAEGGVWASIETAWLK